jgi:hypothetical protein
MQILRQPPYPLSISYSGLEATTDYNLIIKTSDMDETLLDVSITTNGGSFTYELPESFTLYDDSYYLEIRHLVDGDVHIQDNLEIMRPYINPNTLGTTATEIAEYAYYEKIARTMIDAITGGFYFETSWLETVGQGTDYIPLWARTYKILEAYENSQLVWDSTQDPAALGTWNYVLTKDKTAITKDPVQPIDAVNRAEQKPLNIPIAASDSFTLFDTEDSGNTFTISGGVAFPQRWDYLFLLETGYKVVPYDIQEATKMLIDDLKCGKLDYYKRSIVNYSTDQYRIQIEKSALNGTGNILVDKILDKYINTTINPGVL